MIVRYFQESDRAVFLKLCCDFYHSHATLRDYDEQISNTTFSNALNRRKNLKGFLLIDKDSTDPVGYALITSYWCNEEGGTVIVLDELYISPINRHKGYATQFMDWLEKTSKGHAVSLTLEVLTTNVDACHLYSKNGFHPDGFVTYSKRI